MDRNDPLPHDPLPRVVAEAQRDQRRYVARRVVPTLVFLLTWSVLILPGAAMSVQGDLGLVVVLAAWLAGVGAGLGALVLGSEEAERRSEILAEWARRKSATPCVGAGGGAAHPMDRVVEGILARVRDPAQREAVSACRARARELWSEAARRRAALVGPAGTAEGARLLADAADGAEAEAEALDDELAALYAALIGGEARDPHAAVAEAIGRAAAVSEVAELERAAAGRVGVPEHQRSALARAARGGRAREP